MKPDPVKAYAVQTSLQVKSLELLVEAIILAMPHPLRQAVSDNYDHISESAIASMLAHAQRDETVSGLQRAVDHTKERLVKVLQVPQPPED